jgi:UDP-N-acetylglucosamine diphosphorylase/glucosamine-1-phosphate N-acetyltransferase
VSLVFFDDPAARELEPFSLTRPACELRAGAELIRRRWEMAFRDSSIGFVGAPHLRDFDEPWAPGAVSGAIPAGTVLVNSRCAPALEPVSGDADVWRCDGRVAAVRLAAELRAADLQGADALERFIGGGARESVVVGWWVDHVWDLIRHLTVMLNEDIPLLAAGVHGEVSPSITRLGRHQVVIERGVAIDPFVVIDATNGPVLVRRGSVLHSFAQLVGPCYLAEHTTVNGGRISGCSVGEVCRVHGEISATIFLGHANKSHDGFIGHSVLGRWVNLGASTVNSNLKNTYGTVSLRTPRGLEDSGMQFLGTFFGDHAKTAIGTRLTTGCVIGTGANVFGDGVAPKHVPPFSWGSQADEVWALDRFVATAERVMQRRHVALGERGRRHLATVWEHHRRSDTGGDGR